ncbi:mechanosensitive ion channel [Sphingomonas montanisoli]|uniref:Small-conductance mechanosensitive channel n=2 Tax=Sphingomonas montanisoli TaxID=2606412 RepID=A0A5D9C5M3_9SPHN|nr:mechanosensitive ion channel [Sphingomonas montanisoli]
MINGFLAMLPLLVAGTAVFLIFWAIASGVRRTVESVAKRRSEFPSAATAFGRLAYIGLMLLGLLIAVTVAFPSMTPAKLFSVLGIGGVAIGFAFKDIFQNLLAGILLLIRHPFRAGDEITSGGFTGTVESIETRATYIRTYDGQRIIVPNSVIYTEPVTVITAYDLLRSSYDVGIGYSDDVTQAKAIALEAVRSVEGVLAEPAPDVLLWDLAGSSKNLRVRWWTKPKRAGVVAIRDKVLQAVAEALAGAGIDLPFPTQQILFHDQTEASDGDRTRQREGWPAGESPPEPRPLNRVEILRMSRKDEAV